MIKSRSSFYEILKCENTIHLYTKEIDNYFCAPSFTYFNCDVCSKSVIDLDISNLESNIIEICNTSTDSVFLLADGTVHLYDGETLSQILIDTLFIKLYGYFSDWYALDYNGKLYRFVHSKKTVELSELHNFDIKITDICFSKDIILSTDNFLYNIQHNRILKIDVDFQIVSMKRDLLLDSRGQLYQINNNKLCIQDLPESNLKVVSYADGSYYHTLARLISTDNGSLYLYYIDSWHHQPKFWSGEIIDIDYDHAIIITTNSHIYLCHIEKVGNRLLIVANRVIENLPIQNVKSARK